MRTTVLRPRLLVVSLACVAGVLGIAACSSDSGGTAESATSVPRSAAVTVAPGQQHPRTAPGTTLDFGASASLPADAYRAGGSTALYTVTGITQGKDVPSAQTRGGTAYFVYVTVTSLAPRPAPAPKVLGLAGSADGRTAALTLPPSTSLKDCANPKPPETMRRGDSYATCLVAYADEGQKLTRVIYWADTTGDDSLNYKQAPVVWRNPADVVSSSPAPPAG
ncbi:MULTISPECIES: hypothetical protein [Gordonia]|uniref:hypothetical protein n=1 Tax=Gordonia TaxID=2053 RepID=UPI000B0D87A8|nr:hypothetical protein [Gordonia sp. 852002-10350_SCH5691597]